MIARGSRRHAYDLKITASGKAEFQELLHPQFEEDGPVSQTLYGALLFLHLSDLATVGVLIDRRITRLDELIAKLGPIRKELSPVLSTGGEHLLRHLDKQRHLDRDWLKVLLADFQARHVRDVTEPKPLAISTVNRG